jgi:hypothetical protein
VRRICGSRRIYRPSSFRRLRASRAEGKSYFYGM